MNISKIYNANLILSNNYTELCKFLGNTSENDNTIDLELALNICAKLVENTPGEFSNNIDLFGVNNDIVWRDCVVHIVQYLNSLNKSKLTVNVENDFLNELQLSFCRDSNVNINLILNKDINLDFIKTILLFKPLTKILYIVNDQTLHNFYDNYILLSKDNIQFYDFKIEPSILENEVTKKEAYKQISNILDYIKNQFKTDEFPLVPESFKQFINRIIIKDYDNKNKTQVFDYFKLLNMQCGFSLSSSYFIDYNGNIYTCCNCSLTADDNLCCGKYDDATKSFIQLKDEFDLFNLLYTDLLDISKKSTDYDCEKCELSDICMGNCYSINYIQNKGANISSKYFCDYSLFLYEYLASLMMELDADKNELFRDFLFGCSFKGYFEYDR